MAGGNTALNAAAPFSGETARHLIAESELFIEAVHSCYGRMRSAAGAGANAGVISGLTGALAPEDPAPETT